MSNRVIALLLAFVLLWSGLGGIEVPRALAQPGAGQQGASAAAAFAHASVPTTATSTAAAHTGARVVEQVPGQAPHEGSVEDHHLDDLPSQTQGDPPTEASGPPPAALKPGAPLLAMARPRASLQAAARPPFLAGPLRPPCATA